MKKRLAFVLVFALCAALLCIGAGAAEGESWEHIDHNGWTALTETLPDSGMVSAPTVSGNYYFPESAESVSLIEWTIEHDMTLCLGENDYLTVTGDLTIAKGASLTICTCGVAGALWPIDNLDFSGYSKIINNGTLTIASGAINSSFVEGEPCIVNNGTLNLFGGTVNGSEITSGEKSTAIQNNAGATLNMSGAPSISVSDDTPSIVSAGTINATDYTGWNVSIRYTGTSGGTVVTGVEDSTKFTNFDTDEAFATDGNGNLVVSEPVAYGSLLVAGQRVVDGAKYTVKAGLDNNPYEPAYTVELTPIDDEASTEYDFMWDEATHILTLNSATIKATAVSYGSGAGAGQYALFTLNCEEETSLNISLIGNNALTAVNSNVSSISNCPVRVIENLNGDITFTGNGSLTAQVVTDDYSEYTHEPAFTTEYMTAIFANGDVSNQTTLTVKGYEEGKDCITMTGVECNAFSNSGTFTADIQGSYNAQAINAASSFWNAGTVDIDIKGEVVTNNEENDGGANGIGCGSSFTNIGTIDIDISADAHAYGIYGTGEWLNEENATIDISVNTGDSPTPVGGLTVGSGEGWTGPLAGISWKCDSDANTLSMTNHGTLLVSAESVQLATIIYPDWPTWQYCNTVGVLISEGSFSSGSIKNTGTMKLSALNGYTVGVYVSGSDGNFRFENSGDMTIEATTMGGDYARALGIFEQIQIEEGQVIALPLIVNGGSLSITALPVTGYENNVIEGGCMAICLSQAFTTPSTVHADDLQQIVFSGMSESSGKTALVLGPYEVGIFKAAYINTLGVGDTPATSVTILPTVSGSVSIDGTLTEGSTLTASVSGLPAGVTAAYQWQRADSVDGPFEDIDGATGSDYTLTGDDVGKYIRVVVTPTGGEYGGELTATTEGVVQRRSTNIPDTYDIDLIVSDGGSAKTNLTNASAGTTITVTVTPDEGCELAYITVDGERISGTTFRMPAHDVTVRVYFTGGFPFTDVPSGAWYYDAISYVYANGLMDGVSDTLFNPDGNMTRAMVWAILARIDGETVTGANWIDTARAWAMAEGVSDGTDLTGLVTREQLATMLWRYAGEPASEYNLAAFTDADDISAWALDAMRWAVENGIVTGVTATTLEPQGTATRAQCAAILMRYIANI